MNSDTSPTQSSDSASVAFIDLAGFSAIADVYGDAAAIDILEIFEGKVREALAGYEPPIKWIGDEAMLSFPEPEVAIQALGTLLSACREEPRLPLTRSALNHGPVIRRANDLFGSTVNIAARMASLASPGQLLATQPIAEAAAARGILVQDLGKVALRSVAERSPALRDRACAVARPGLDRSRMQDACSLCILSTGCPGRAVVLFAALRRGVSEVAADLSVAAMTAGPLQPPIGWLHALRSRPATAMIGGSLSLSATRYLVGRG